MFQPISREEYRKIRGGKMYGKENCPFCDQEGMKKTTFRKGKYWRLIHALASYSGDERHLMAIPHDHIILSKDLTENHFQELKIVHQEVRKFFGHQDYFSFTRETLATYRSVEHLHIHFLVGELQGRYLRKMLEQQGYPIQQELYFE